MTPIAFKYAMEAAERHGVKVGQIFGPQRGSKAVAAARFDTMLKLSEHGYDNTEIGKMMNRDRSTVHYALRRGAGAPPKIVYPRQTPKPEVYEPVDINGYREVMANHAAMQAKHQRELASRY